MYSAIFYILGGDVEANKWTLMESLAVNKAVKTKLRVKLTI